MNKTLKVLLVEDEPWLAELYTALLEKSGYSVTCCQDNYDAISGLEQPLPAVIILDLFLPWTNGLQLLHEIASHIDLARIPIILCSSALTPDISVQNLKPYGVVGVLDKTTMVPYDIVKAVEEAIDVSISL